VPAVTLDGLVERGVIDLDRVGLVWVDAQRHEGQVLAGASTFRAAGIPTMVAVRPEVGKEEEALRWAVPAAVRRTVVEAILAGYTHSVELRKHSKVGRKLHPIDSLDDVVDSFRHCQDLLLVRLG
jgi:hypothetical protein